MSHAEHLQKAEEIANVTCYLLTTSDTRTLETDEAGPLAASLLTNGGFVVAGREIVRNDTFAIRERIEAILEKQPDFILVTGGTGTGKRDVSLEAVLPLMDKILDGFGEIFRWLTFQEIGPSAMLTRATLGVSNGVVIAMVPGSPGAIRLACERLILPAVKHILWEIRK
jgi:molybdenum cofactor biosynthesis protein B